MQAGDQLSDHALWFISSNRKHWDSPYREDFPRVPHFPVPWQDSYRIRLVNQCIRHLLRIDRQPRAWGHILAMHHKTVKHILYIAS